MANRDEEIEPQDDYDQDFNDQDQEKQPINKKEKTSDDEKRDNYLDGMIKQIQENRKGVYQCECCLAFWLFLILGLIFTLTVTKEECQFLGNLTGIFIVLCNCFVCCRLCDCCCIILPLGKKTIHYATSFHYWNNEIQYQTCKWFLILLTIFWFFFETCEGFRGFVTGFLIITWILVIIWKCLESD